METVTKKGSPGSITSDGHCYSACNLKHCRAASPGMSSHSVSFTDTLFDTTLATGRADDGPPVITVTIETI